MVKPVNGQPRNQIWKGNWCCSNHTAHMRSATLQQTCRLNLILLGCRNNHINKLTKLVAGLLWSAHCMVHGIWMMLLSGVGQGGASGKTLDRCYYCSVGYLMITTLMRVESNQKRKEGGKKCKHNTRTGLELDSKPPIVTRWWVPVPSNGR